MIPAADSARSTRGARYARFVAALFGAGWFLWIGGRHVVSPTRIEWMFRDDWLAHLFGWLFFRRSDWLLPLGSAPLLFHPHGTSLAFCDSHPWLGVFFKAISFALPEHFQYFGLWLGLCVALLGYFGARLTSVFTADPVAQALGGVLCAMSPLVPGRYAHPTLCAQWLLVAMIWLNLRRETNAAEKRSTLLIAAALNVFAVGTHAYWGAFVAALSFALACRWVIDDRRLLPGAALLGVCAALSVATLWLFGFLGDTRPELNAEGFGQFSSDLNALFNPVGSSRFFKGLPLRPRQGEGFAYLGAGVLFLLAFSAAAAVRHSRGLRPAMLRALPLAAICLLCATYAWSNIITFNGNQVAELSSLYAHVPALTNTFRVSARFIWALHQLLFAAALGAVCLWQRARWPAWALLAVAAVVQGVEHRAEAVALARPLPTVSLLSDPVWTGLGTHYAHVAQFPVQAQWTCSYDERQVVRTSMLAYREHMTMNGGYASRTPPEVRARCDEHLDPAALRDDTVYFVARSRVEEFLRAGALCAMIEGEIVCISRHKASPLRDAMLGSR